MKFYVISRKNVSVNVCASPSSVGAYLFGRDITKYIVVSAPAPDEGTPTVVNFSSAEVFDIIKACSAVEEQ